VRPNPHEVILIRPRKGWPPVGIVRRRRTIARNLRWSVITGALFAAGLLSGSLSLPERFGQIPRDTVSTSDLLLVAFTMVGAIVSLLIAGIPAPVFRRRQATRKIAPPGWRILVILKYVYSTESFEGVFRPAIVDMQHEHIAALAEGRPWKALWNKLVGYWSIGSAVLAQLPVSLIKVVAKLWTAVS